jgi:hypothetical protein
MAQRAKAGPRVLPNTFSRLPTHCREENCIAPKRDYRKKNPSKVDDNKTDTYKDRSNAAANKERDV